MGLRREARETLAQHGLRPQRRFGQNFLCDAGVVRRIVACAGVGRESVVLEIGPGLGALTDTLAAEVGRLYLVEVDRGLAERLAERHRDNPRVRLVEGDVLALPLETLVAEPEVTVVANLPYNIATPILFRLLALRHRFPRAVLMLQREVAQRLASRPGSKDWGVLSVLVQTWAEVAIAFGVSRRSFVPQPKVESAVVDVRWRAAPRADVGDPERYRALVRAAFGQRRKTLRNALGALAVARGFDAAALTAAFASAGVDPGRRAESLDLADFARLARALGG
ncbi:MAG: 16S rRNA (adenine(1518)-N(6)/adenine(1519)-N(6))-dimethyltransferase RsmA [bacterium]|nr:16S rRNA (adenine(1518)-N(6)/adenine(1519)-N(6))-dimethyltransferase RsmA [bacterium]